MKKVIPDKEAGSNYTNIVLIYVSVLKNTIRIDTIMYSNIAFTKIENITGI